MNVFQQDILQPFLSPIQEDTTERWEQNMDEDIMMQFVKSGYVIEV